MRFLSVSLLLLALAEGQENSLRCQGFQCHDGSCVRRSSYCDGRQDCPDGSDEAMCGLPLATTTTGVGVSSTTAGSGPSKDSNNIRTPMSQAYHKTVWIITGTTLGALITAICITILLFYVVVAIFSVKRIGERKKSHPKLLEYDNVPMAEEREYKGEDEDNDHLDVSEMTELIPQPPPSYKDLKELEGEA